MFLSYSRTNNMFIFVPVKSSKLRNQTNKQDILFKILYFKAKYDRY